MLKFQIGEVTTRLRQALGVRGRMPLGLDEHLIPVVTAGQVDVPPFRTNPVRGYAAAYSQAIVVGRFADIELHFSYTNVPPDLMFVVDRITLQPLDYTTATGIQIPLAEVGAFILTPRNSTAFGFSCYSTERYPQPLTLAQFQIPIGLDATFSLVNPLGIGGQFMRAVDRTGDTEFVWQGEIPIQGVTALTFRSFTAATAAITSALACSVTGLFYTSPG